MSPSFTISLYILVSTVLVDSAASFPILAFAFMSSRINPDHAYHRANARNAFYTDASRRPDKGVVPIAGWADSQEVPSVDLVFSH